MVTCTFICNCHTHFTPALCARAVQPNWYGYVAIRVVLYLCF
jgi:hypothetical protein